MLDSTLKIEVSRDVNSEENKVWDWVKKDTDWVKKDTTMNRSVSNLTTMQRIQSSSRKYTKASPDTTPQEDTIESEASTPHIENTIWTEIEESLEIMRKAKSLNDIYSRAYR